MKVVIDTNVFVSSFFGGPPKKVIELWKNGRITICLTQSIIEEYIDVLLRLGIPQGDVDELVELFSRGYFCLYINQTAKLNVVEKDPDDNKFFECAVKHKAQYIITGDKRVLAVKKYLQIEVVSPAVFLSLIR